MNKDQWKYKILEVENGNTQMKRKKKTLSQIFSLFTILFNTFLIGLILNGNYQFARLKRNCTSDSEAQCYHEQLEPILFELYMTIFFIALPFSIVFFLGFMNLFQRQLSIAVLVDFIGLLYLYHGRPGFYDFSYIFSKIMVISVIGVMIFLSLIFIVIKIGIITYRRQISVFLFYIFALTTLWALTDIWYQLKLSDTSGFRNGIIGKTLKDKSSTGQEYCQLILPKKDYYNLFSGIFDMTFHFYDCTQVEYKDQIRQTRYLQKFIPLAKDFKYIGIPQFNQLTKTYTRIETQKYLFDNARGYKNLKDVPSDIEYVLDVKNLEYIIDVKLNKSLIEKRSQIRKTLEQNRVNNSVSRSLPKNIIVLYIDALSRVRLQSKLPKVFNWFDEQNQIKKKDHVFFQAMRGISLAYMTYHNIIAYFFGVQTESQINMNTRYSLTKNYMDVKYTTQVNKFTGKNYTQREYQDATNKNYQSLIQDFQQSGYITGMTNTDCAVSPFTQTDIVDKNYKLLINDHMGFAPACDPNYFNIEYMQSISQGPYGVMKRCLYGKEMIDYSIEYSKQFLTKYKDQTKFFQMELLEAHERSQEVITYQDQKIYDYLNWLDEEGHLKDSVFLLLSDHGYHMYSMDYQHITNEMIWGDTMFPIQIFMMPSNILNEKDIQSLQENEQKVITMFEIHYFFKYLISSDDGEQFRRDSIVSDEIPVDRDSTTLPQCESQQQSCRNKKTK